MNWHRSLSGLEAEEIKPEDGDILVIAQKIVSKAEGRLVNLNEVEPSPDAESLAGKRKRIRDLWNWSCEKAAKCCVRGLER
jgi:F420-0:gamma-glutamyl ligase